MTLTPNTATTDQLREALANLRRTTGDSNSQSDRAGRIKIKAIEYALTQRGETA